MASSKGNAVVGQSGGPTSVINQSLVGVITEARRHGHIDKLLGARHGVRGIINDEFVELNNAPDELRRELFEPVLVARASTGPVPG